MDLEPEPQSDGQKTPLEALDIPEVADNTLAPQEACDASTSGTANSNAGLPATDVATISPIRPNRLDTTVSDLPLPVARDHKVSVVAVDRLSRLVQCDDADELDFGAYESIVFQELENAKVSPSGLAGSWKGSCADQNEKVDSAIQFSITHEGVGGQFLGSGTDVLGAFTVSGVLDNPILLFTKNYIGVEDGLHFRYEGEVNEERNEIIGRWGRRQHHEDILGPVLDLEKEDYAGTFQLLKRPLEYFQCRPSVEEFEVNRTRALWKFALNAVLNGVRSRSLSWQFLRERRDRRHRFIWLFIRRREMHDGWGEHLLWSPLDSIEQEELDTFETTLSTADRRFYSSLASFYFRRETVHS